MADDANAVRSDRGAELLPFPAEAIIRRQPGHRGDQVAVTHRGETAIYASPADLALAFRAHDPVLTAAIAEAKAAVAGALAAADKARLLQGLAARRQAEADRLLRMIFVGAVIAAALAVVVLL